MRIAILHPGEMGVTVGAAMARSGHEVCWLPQGRSAQTASRARAAGFRACDSLSRLVECVAGVVSVCPPHGAVDVARSVMAAGFTGTYLDANALAPDSARRIGAIVGEGFVDGGIIGPPALKQGSTRLYLAGDHSAEVAQWFAAGALQAIPLSGAPGTASALKMCYAAYTKGSSALLLAVRALAEAQGVSDALLHEWEISQPGLAGRSEAAALSTAPKAWRFVGEMLEIADTFHSAGLPAGFHQAAAELYRRMESLREGETMSLETVLALLNSGSAIGEG